MVGVAGGEDPYNRATYPWEDEGGTPDKALLAEFRKLTALRHAHPILRRGESFAPLFVSDNVVVMARRLNSQWALVAVNNARTAQRVTISLPAGGSVSALHDPLGGSAPQVTKGQLTIEVDPLSGRLLIGR
jgi:cyclomaltodextrinase / maltogenic alpha-amylase / neopullulanase